MNWMQKSVVVVLALVGLANAAQAQQPSPDSLAKLQAHFMQLAQPGPEHALLVSMSGKWNVEGTMWPMPGAEPMKNGFLVDGKMVLGGRFLQTESKGEIMGMPMEMIGYMGYDRRQQKYTMLGMDTQGTYWVTAFGTYDAKSKTLLLYGEDFDPTINSTQKYDFRFTFADADHFTVELIFKNPEITGGAPEFKMMELKYARTK